jgi:hypothetical protein
MYYLPHEQDLKAFHLSSILNFTDLQVNCENFENVFDHGNADNLFQHS